MKGRFLFILARGVSPGIFVASIRECSFEGRNPEIYSIIPVNNSFIPQSNSSPLRNNSFIPKQTLIIPINNSFIPRERIFPLRSNSFILKQTSIIPLNKSFPLQNNSFSPKNNSLADKGTVLFERTVPFTVPKKLSRKGLTDNIEFASSRWE